MKHSIEGQNILLGFLTLKETINHDGYLGAILITDLQGIPQEFRCTLPVKPTNIQKPLYGDTLKPYIGVSLCGVPLIKTVQNKPDLVIVSEEFLLDVRKESTYPVIFIRRAGEVIDVKMPDSSETTVKRERINCSAGRFQPIVFESHPSFNDDMAIAREILDKIFSYLDPTEPFDRISKAIEILGKQDNKFQ